MVLLLIFIGGGLGSLCRYGIGQLFPYSGGFPWATFFINLVACFILGLVLGWISRQVPNAALTNNIKWLLATGFCGGFSTFSTFSGETFTLIKEQQWPLAAIYVGLSLFSGLLMLALGAALRF